MPATSWQRIAPPFVSWGETLCSRRRCPELAECTLERWPFCIVHADDELERQLAWEINPEAVRLMPDLEEDSPW